MRYDVRRAEPIDQTKDNLVGKKLKALWTRRFAGFHYIVRRFRRLLEQPRAASGEATHCADARKALEFLEDARPFSCENRFILGTFERGVTVYRQQIRALNLIYSFVESKDSLGRNKIAPGSRVVVVGGGAFGTTVAVAAAYAGFRVMLLERHQALLHLQRGCDTRWLHPRFYDWPAPEAETTLARLPFLDWPAGSAGEVAAEIEREFVELSRGRLRDRLRYVLNAEVRIKGVHENVYEVHYRTAFDQSIVVTDIVIYAVGFGTENSGRGSYWRNDQYGQTDLTYKDKGVRYVVSGFGDGALVDLFRLTIRDFKYEHIFLEMFGQRDDGLFSALERIARNADRTPGSLFDRLSELEQGTYAEAFAKAKTVLKDRVRSDTSVVLNARADSFRLGLALQGISCSNAVLAYLLYRINALTYEPAEIDVTDVNEPRLAGVDESAPVPHWLAGANLIVRHGTNREDALNSVGCGDAVRFLREKANRESGIQIFPAGWWGPYTDPDAADSAKAPPRIEHVPPVLVTHATTFVSTLASVLAHLIDLSPENRERTFRVTLHRLVRFDGEDVFQQVTPYFGRIDKTSGIGRFFSVKAGIVGLACRTGSLVVVRKEDEAKFARVWALTDLRESGAKTIRPYVDSLLCCPIFFPDTSDGSKSVALALFADSAHADFFAPEVIETISAGCRGFVRVLEDLTARGALRPLLSVASGYKVPRTRDEKMVAELRGLGVMFKDETEEHWKEGLTFKRLTSLDLEVGYSANLTSPPRA